MNTRSKTALLPRASLSKRESCPHPLPAYLRVESLLSHTLSAMFSCFGSSTMAHSLHKAPSKLLSHHHHPSHNQQQQSRGLANDFPPLPSAVCSAAVLSKYVALLCEHSSPSHPSKHAPLLGHPNLAKHVHNPFHLHHPPPLPLAEFADRLHKYFACSSAAFIVSSLYLHRLHSARPALFTPRSAHKLLLTALTLAAKFCDDVACKQSHYAKCGGIEVAELNALESFFASALKFELFVATEAFERAVGVLGHVHKAFEVAGTAEQEEAVYVVSAFA